jgi:hypothetical protein
MQGRSYSLVKIDPIKKPPKGYSRSSFGGFISAISGNPFSWLSPGD